MDEYDQIKYDLWVIKKGKEAQTLSPYAIAQAFGDEALEIIPRVNAVLLRRLVPLRDEQIRIREVAHVKKYDKFTLDFLLDCSFMLSHLRQTAIHLERNKKILTLAERRKTITDNPTANPVNLDTIAQAKTIPILSLYSFEKQKNLGSKIQACCPFHGEKTASFFIYTNKNTCHCFGCSFNGSAIDFYMKLHNTDFKDAVKALVGV